MISHMGVSMSIEDISFTVIPTPLTFRAPSSIASHAPFDSLPARMQAGAMMNPLNIKYQKKLLSF